MYKIQSNASNTRHIEVSEAHLETIRKYSLFSHLIDSSGIINEEVLDKLKYNIRGLLESDTTKDNALLDLCLDVIYNQNMKRIRTEKPHKALHRMAGYCCWSRRDGRQA